MMPSSSSSGLALDLFILTDPGTADLPSDGTDQTWDLSSVTLEQVGTMAFTAAANTPFAGSYPTANWAWAQELTGVGPSIVYLNISAAGIDVLATDVPGDTENYSDPKRILQFPMPYGNSFVDAYTGTSGSGAPTWIYSGHGTLITPLGTTTNVAKVTSTEGDLLLWNTDPLYPLVIDNGEEILFYGIDPNASVHDRAAKVPSVYPNPATHTLWVEAGAGAEWRMMDLQGRELRQGRTGNTVQALDVQALAQGTYLLVLSDAQGTRTVRFDKQAF
jgi:hypothetical protein